MSEDSDAGVSEEELDRFLNDPSNEYTAAFISHFDQQTQRRILGHMKQIPSGLGKIQAQIEASRKITTEDLQKRCNVTRIY